MKKINVITIDGPSASGKGALARGIAINLISIFLIVEFYTDSMLIYLK